MARCTEWTAISDGVNLHSEARTEWFAKMTEREKMEAGLWYDSNFDQDLLKEREEAEALLNPLSSGGYGRIYAVPAQSFGQFSQKAAVEFESGHIRFYGGRQVKKAASFCGAGCDDEAIAFAISRGADTFVSADMKHHQITALISAGLNVVEMTHYCSEVYGFARIYASINGSLGVPSAFFKEEMLL